MEINAFDPIKGIETLLQGRCSRFPIMYERNLNSAKSLYERKEVVGLSTRVAGFLCFFSRCQYTLLGQWLRQHSYSWWKRNPWWIHVSDVKTLKCASCVICSTSWHLVHKIWSCIPLESGFVSGKNTAYAWIQSLSGQSSRWKCSLPIVWSSWVISWVYPIGLHITTSSRVETAWLK